MHALPRIVAPARVDLDVQREVHARPEPGLQLAPRRLIGLPIRGDPTSLAGDFNVSIKDILDLQGEAIPGVPSVDVCLRASAATEYLGTAELADPEHIGTALTVQTSLGFLLTMVTIEKGADYLNKLERVAYMIRTKKCGESIKCAPGDPSCDEYLTLVKKKRQEIQKLGQVRLTYDGLESQSERGRSTITVRIKDKYTKAGLPQVWDELRRKVGDAQGQLPPGAGPSLVVDDFGDVWGIFLAIHGDEYSTAELRHFAKLLRRELLLVKDVAKVDFYAEQREVIYVELSRDKLSQLGIPEQQIIQKLRQKNVAAESGRLAFSVSASSVAAAAEPR